jgi:MtN3 and saliva related transmembrane protein
LTVTTTLGVTAATWAMLMALSPLLQVREIRRRRSSDGISIGYFWVLLVGFALWVAYGLARGDLPLVLPNSSQAGVLGHRREHERASAKALRGAFAEPKRGSQAALRSGRAILNS